MARLLARSRLAAASAACLVGFTVAGCGGGGGGSTPPGPVGVWDGTFTEEGTIGSMHAQLAVFPGGNVRVRQGSSLQYASLGTWLRSESTFVLQYQYDGSVCSGLLMLSGDDLGGSWGYGAETNGGGQFAFTRGAAPGVGIWQVTSTEPWFRLVCYPDGSAELAQNDLSQFFGPGTCQVSGPSHDVFTAQVNAGDLLDFAGILSGESMTGTVTMGGLLIRDFTASLVH